VALPLLIIWISVAVVSALAGTTIAIKWDNIVIALKGKRLAILGARAVGKTHLFKFLTTGSIPTEYSQHMARKTTAHRFQLKDLDLKIRESLDLPGAEDAYPDWKKVFNEADFVFYLLRADRLLAGDSGVEQRVRADLRHIGEWLNNRIPQPPLFIIGTFCDLDPEFKDLSPDKRGDYVDKFRRLPIVFELMAHAGGTWQNKVILGSMKSLLDTEALVYEIFNQVKP